MNRLANHWRLFSISNLMLVAALLSVTGWATAQEPSRSAENLRRDRLNTAKLAYKRVIKEANGTTEAIRLKQRIEDYRYAMEAAKSRAEAPEYESRYGGGYGLGAIARRFGEGAGRLTATKHAQQNRRAMERAEGELDAYVKKTGWKLLSADEQAMFVELFPDFVREVGAADRLPESVRGSRPNNWVKFQPPGESFAYWTPVRPEREGGPGKAYRAIVSKGNTEYLLVVLDLGPTARPADDAGFRKRMVEGLAKPVNGNLVHSETCTVMGKPGHQATIEFLDVGVPRHLTAKCFAERSKLYVFSVLQAQEQADEPMKDWFFDSISAI